MRRRRRDGIKARIVKTERLSSHQKRRMLHLMQKYYDGIRDADFFRDLEDKDHVILLFNRVTGYLEGFSTLKSITLIDRGRSVRGIFSGDTVLEREFWGSRSLGKTFLFYLWRQGFAKPWQPLYWLLMSKGYKTYLLMANNFRDYTPRPDQSSFGDHIQLRDLFYSALFAQRFNPQTGLVDNGPNAPRLRAHVAAPSAALYASNLKVRYFVDNNSTWAQGTELACLARMTWWMPFYYVLKSTATAMRQSHKAKLLATGAQ